MESTQEGQTSEKNPPLPANYVSIVQLQERWLQQQKQKLENGEQKEKQRLKQQAQEEGKLHRAPQNRGLEKEKQKLGGNRELGSKRNDWRRLEGHQKVYVPKRVIPGNLPRNDGIEKQFMSEEVSLCTPAHYETEVVVGMEEKNVSRGQKEKTKKKRVVGVEGSLNKVEENRENLGSLRCRNGGMRGCRGEFGRSGNVDERDEGNGSVCVAEVVPENKRKEENPLGKGGICGVSKGFKEQDRGYGDDWTLEGSVYDCATEALPGNGWGEEVPAALNAYDKGLVEAVGSICMVETFPENEVEEDCSVSTRRKNGEGLLRKNGQEIFRNRYRRNFSNSRKGRFSQVSKIYLRCQNNKVEGVSLEENDRNSDQKGLIGSRIQVHGEKRENLRDLSWRNDGMKRCRGKLGRSGIGDEGDASVCMVEVVLENEGKEASSLSMGPIHGVNEEHDWGTTDDWRMGENLCVCKIEVLPENEREEVPVAVNAYDKGIVEATGSVHVVEILPENGVEEDCSVSDRRKKGEGIFRKKDRGIFRKKDQGIFTDRYLMNFSGLRKGRFSKVSTIQSRHEMNRAGEGVSVGEQDSKSDQKVWTGRGIQPYEKNIGNSGDLSGRNDGMERRGEYERRRNGDEGDEGNAHVCMVDIVAENDGKEETYFSTGRANEGFNEQDWVTSNDSRLEGNVSVCMIEVLPENGWGKEVPGAGNVNDQGIIAAVGSAHTVEILPETDLEEGCSVGARRKKGEGIFRKRGQGNIRDRYWRNFSDLRKGRFSKVSKIDSRRENSKVEEGVSDGENDRKSDQNGWASSGIQAYGDTKIVSGNLSPKIIRDLRGLSLDGKKEGNVASRKWQHGFKQRGHEKSIDHSLVWVKKENNSDTHAA